MQQELNILNILNKKHSNIEFFPDSSRTGKEKILLDVFATVQYECKKHGKKSTTFLEYVIDQVCCSNTSIVDNPLTLYIVEFKSKDEVFYKIGTTTKTIKERFLNISNYEVITHFEFTGEYSHIFQIEKALHKFLIKFKYSPSLFNFDGKTECYFDLPNNLKNIFDLKFDLKNSKKKYEKKRIIMPVSFNIETESELIAAAKSIPNYSNWVKEQLKKYIKYSSS